MECSASQDYRVHTAGNWDTLGRTIDGYMTTQTAIDDVVTTCRERTSRSCFPVCFGSVRKLGWARIRAHGEPRWDPSVPFPFKRLVPLQVMIDVDGKQEWKECAEIPGVHLPQGYYFGASSLTGDLSGLDKTHAWWFCITCLMCQLERKSRNWPSWATTSQGVKSDGLVVSDSQPLTRPATSNWLFLSNCNFQHLTSQRLTPWRLFDVWLQITTTWSPSRCLSWRWRELPRNWRTSRRWRYPEWTTERFPVMNVNTCECGVMMAQFSFGHMVRWETTPPPPSVWSFHKFVNKRRFKEKGKWNSAPQFHSRLRCWSSSKGSPPPPLHQ